MVPSGHVAPEFVRLAAHELRWRLLTELSVGDYRVRELVARTGQPQNLVSYHLRLLRDGGLIRARRSSHDGRDSYYHLDLERCAQALAAAGTALHPALRLDPAVPPATVPRGTPPDLRVRPIVLFLCTGNSARSPIAEALLRHRSGGRVEAASAGSHPKAEFHPDTVRVLRQHYDIDLAGHHPRHLDTVADRRFDYVISLCDKVREVCPDFGGRPRLIHWSIPDPATTGSGDAAHTAFDRTAAEIDTRVRQLLPVLAHHHHEEVQQ